MQFPEREGPLTGFAVRIADSGIAGERVEDAEQMLGVRILAIDGDCDCAGDGTIAPGARLVVFGTIEALIKSAPRQPDAAKRPLLVQRLRRAAREGHWRLRRTDPYIAGLAAVTLALFFAATWHFRDLFEIEWLTAAYFVMSTLTTTGYGDITPHRNDVLDVVTAMLLMLAGTVFTGIFIAMAAARLTRAQWVRMQGLRPIQRRGHIVLCGCGSIGTGVIDLLLAFDRPLVVIDPSPDAALIERARDRGFDLLTGDASCDDTLDLCNLGEAHSVVALTNVDTLNLEIALGARARNPGMPIVLRIAEAEFAASIARHFDFETTFSVAALAGPVFAGLSRGPGRARPDRVRRPRIRDHRNGADRPGGRRAAAECGPDRGGGSRRHCRNDPGPCRASARNAAPGAGSSLLTASWANRSSAAVSPKPMSLRRRGAAQAGAVQDARIAAPRRNSGRRGATGTCCPTSADRPDASGGDR